MSTAKVAITLRQETLREVDRWVKEGQFANRSRAIQCALAERVARHKRRRLVDQLARLGRKPEQALADEFLRGETPWPEY